MKIPYQRSQDKFGFTQFLDERGLSNKAKKRQVLQEKLLAIEAKVEFTLSPLKIKLFTNSTTVVSNPYYSQLDQVIEHTYKMWTEINYPFKEQIYIRTCTFDKAFDFSLPSKSFDIYCPKTTAEDILKDLPVLGNPEQILLHPRFSEDSLKKRMSVGRFESLPGRMIFEIGFGNVADVKYLNNADTIYNGEVNERITFREIKKGKKGLEESEIVKIAKAAKIILPFLEQEMLSQEDQKKNVVAEFQILDYEEFKYMLFTEIERV